MIDTDEQNTGEHAVQMLALWSRMDQTDGRTAETMPELQATAVG